MYNVSDFARVSFEGKKPNNSNTENHFCFCKFPLIYSIQKITSKCCQNHKVPSCTTVLYIKIHKVIFILIKQAWKYMKQKRDPIYLTCWTCSWVWKIENPSSKLEILLRATEKTSGHAPDIQLEKGVGQDGEVLSDLNHPMILWGWRCQWDDAGSTAEVPRKNLSA